MAKSKVVQPEVEQPEVKMNEEGLVEDTFTPGEDILNPVDDKGLGSDVVITESGVEGAELLYVLEAFENTVARSEEEVEYLVARYNYFKEQGLI